MATDWKVWYFSKARKPPSKRVFNLLFNEIGPGCSNKMLAAIAEGVLDIGNPFAVDWRFIRPAHIWMMRHKMDRRTMSAGMSNARRLVSKGIQRRVNPWILDQLGWKVYKKVGALEIVDEDQFKAIEDGAVLGQPEDLAVGIRAILRLIYYAGLNATQAGMIRYDDLVYADGRALLYKSGRLIELPDHVRLPIAEWIRVRAEKRTRGRLLPNALIFRADQKAVCYKHTKLSETFKSFKRLSA